MAHGSKHFDILAPRSKFYHGPFGRLCPELEPWQPADSSDSHLLKTANTLMVELPGKFPAEIANDDAILDDLETKFGSSTPAGYTYFGQFVDHDITFDPTSSLMRKNDPNGLINFRTPRLDLDNVYGSGRANQPYLYEQDVTIPDHKAKLAVGHIAGRPELPDLPRFGNVALIGDMRNDENSMVSQLQLAFILAHNNLVDLARKQDQTASTETLFERARTTLRWLYQHIVWNDFIPRIVINEVHACALKLEKACGGRQRWAGGLQDVYSWKNQPFMPVEFSVAAYRFGHSMVRNSYQTNQFGKFIPIFDNTGTSNDPEDLRGFRPLLAENCLQWDWFLPMNSSVADVGFPQMARKIDTKMANALAFLHEEKAGDPMNVLAFRNLKRSLSFDLPSGTAMAKKFCVKPLELKADEPDALWYYILREAQGNGGNTLGRVGSIIVSSVFAGLLKGDPQSYFNIDPCWTPDDDALLTSKDTQFNQDDDKWTLACIIRLAGLKANGIGFE